MALPRLPQEIADYIVDLLHDEPETLKRCCLVSKSWISRVRRHLFYEIRIDRRADLAAWKRVFPDPANSPGYYTRSLRITSVDITAADFEEGGWFRAFSNVVRLKACDYPGSFRLQVFTLIRSLPLLKDVHLRGQGAENNDDSPIFRPPALPLLTGTLTISLAQGTLELAARQLLDLPNGIRFREFWCTVHTKEDVRWMATLVDACSGTLEHIDIKDLTWEESWAGSIDFSKATKLKGLTFRSFNRSVKWITMALKAITAHHRDLREVMVHVHFPPSGDCVNLRQIAGGLGFKRWIDLNSVLTRLMESHAVCVKTIHYPTGGDDLVREFMKEMFPAISTERGWSPRVRFADFDWEM